MQNLRWILGTTPESLSQEYRDSIRELFMKETGENYNDTVLGGLKIPDWPGNMLLVKSDDSNAELCIQGVFWSKPVLETNIRIVAFVIDAKAQNIGLGTIAMHKIIQIAKQNGRKIIQLEVRKNNEKAQRFYKKFGFQISEKIPNYYKDDDGYVMKLFL